VQPVRVGEDRSMVVPPGATVLTGYVAIEQIVLANKDRIAIGDVERAMQRRMSCAPASPWPTPVGEWRGDRFWIFDGRHETVAALMLACTHILVAWVDG
jgi:hypothetical protein